MSIFQDFESIRNNIGHEKYDMINEYLDTISLQENIDKYFKEMNSIWKLPPETWNDKANQLKKKYGVILLDDVLHNKEEWEKYEDWYNQNKLHRNIKILGTWTTDYDDIRCNAVLYQDGNKVANIIASYDENDIRYSIGDQDSELNEEFVNNAFKSLIYESFNSYVRLPKISECSKLLQSIYDDVCASDSSMCHITEEDWDEFYLDDYTNEDFEILKKEVETFSLNDVIGINDMEYKIVGYGDLEIRFNDDRNLEMSNEMEMEI